MTFTPDSVRRSTIPSRSSDHIANSSNPNQRTEECDALLGARGEVDEHQEPAILTAASQEQRMTSCILFGLELPVMLTSESPLLPAIFLLTVN